MKIRRAKTQDVKTIQKLVNDYAERHKMIPRSLNDLYENLRDLVVCEEEGQIVGTCALHIVWEDLAEIRSLAVRKGAQGRGVGKSLIKRAIREAKAAGVKRVFSLTYVPDFFKTMGFRDFDKSDLPHKIWGDCLNCHKFPDCDEVAVIIDL